MEGFTMTEQRFFKVGRHIVALANVASFEVGEIPCCGRGSPAPAVYVRTTDGAVIIAKDGDYEPVRRLAESLCEPDDAGLCPHCGVKITPEDDAAGGLCPDCLGRVNQPAPIDIPF